MSSLQFSNELPTFRLFTQQLSDPVAAKLAKEDGTPAGNVTGTSDELPIKAQLEMIREMLPDAKNIGILYTTSEANSVSALAKYKELAGDYGFTIVDKGISTDSRYLSCNR